MGAHILIVLDHQDGLATLTRAAPARGFGSRDVVFGGVQPGQVDLDRRALAELPL